MNPPRPLAPLLLGVGTLALAVTVPLALTHGSAAKELPWVGGTVVFLAMAALVLRRRPHDEVAHWFAIAAGLVALVQTSDGLLLRLAPVLDPGRVAWLTLAHQLLLVVTSIALAHLLGLFPDHRIERRYERRVVTALWTLPVLPVVALLASPTLVLPTYHRLPDIANPLRLEALSALGPAAAAGVSALQGTFVVGAALLVPRYRRADARRRRTIRWLLVPVLLAAVVAVTDLVLWWLLPAGAPSPAFEVGLGALWILTVASLPTAIAVALLRPEVLDVDQVIRRSLVYGALWSLIAFAYVAAAAALGLAAGRRLPLGVAIGLTVVATLVFQPARHRLEQAADRWVFGSRADPARVIARLGDELEATVGLERLLPRMAATLQEGLGLTWARVRLEPPPPGGDPPPSLPALSVPIELDGERLGTVECGPRRHGRLTPDDEAVVTTFAHQAALAVRNVRLTAELERSRARLVRAQEAERRRIERNLHDGVQQHLVALLGHAARARSSVERDPASGMAALDELREGLAHALEELRELARGIHPSVLSDRGLLEAVEALAARSPLAVTVRADPALRGLRFAEEVEGAGYFTVAEALANAGKHAGACRVEVRLECADDGLDITVRDDGPGFAPAEVTGGGLTSLAERLAALGGRLELTSGLGDGTTLHTRLRVADG